MKKIFVIAILCIVSWKSFGQKKKFIDSVNADFCVSLLWHCAPLEEISPDSITCGDAAWDYRTQFYTLREDRAASLALYLIQNAGDSTRTAVLSKNLPNVIFLTSGQVLILFYSPEDKKWNAGIPPRVPPLRSEFARFFCLKRRDRPE